MVVRGRLVALWMGHKLLVLRWLLLLMLWRVLWIAVGDLEISLLLCWHRRRL